MEILSFSARMRLTGVEDSKMAPLLDDLLSSLGLSSCANTVVGNELIKGISGGQRKRTSVGAELITNPAITFLDEPTSGLDTSAAYQVCSVLKELANANQAVMCTIHQPSSEIFQLFDSAIFISRGRVMYQGHPSGIRAHFDKLSFRCPQDYNTADFVMFLIGTEDQQQFEKLNMGWRDAAADKASGKQDTAVPMPKPAAGKGFFVELKELTSRELRKTARDVGMLKSRFALTIVQCLIFGLIFTGVGKSGPDYDVQSHTGALTMVGINAMMTATQPTLISFPSERPVFLREYASNMYGVVPYFVSKSCVEFVILVVQVTVALIVCYWLMALQGNFGVLVAAFSLLGGASSSIALLIGCAVGDVKQAIELAPLVMVPQILFAGFFIKLSMIPVWLRWIQYICGLKWATNISWANEFAGAVYEKAVLTRNDIDPSMNWLNYVILALSLIHI